MKYDSRGINLAFQFTEVSAARERDVNEVKKRILCLRRVIFQQVEDRSTRNIHRVSFEVTLNDGKEKRKFCGRRL